MPEECEISEDNSKSRVVSIWKKQDWEGVYSEMSVRGGWENWKKEKCKKNKGRKKGNIRRKRVNIQHFLPYLYVSSAALL